jgi:nucleoid DNA-binding protein
MATKVKKANRTQLIEKLSVSLGVSKAQAEKILNTVLDSVVEMVVDGYDVNLTGFGAFHKVFRKERDGINPKTREKMKIPASTSVGFKVGKTFKEAVKGA